MTQQNCHPEPVEGYKNKHHMINTVTYMLRRTYFPNGTNGELFGPSKTELCKTIELPWKENKRRESCIPEGRYLLKKRTSEKFKQHLILMAVPGRDLILIHPANNAIKELAGCIAPVTELTGPGTGNTSRIPFNKLRDEIYALIENGYDVYIEITKK